MFVELGPIRSDEPQPSIFDSVLDEELPDAARVVAYLRAGHLLIGAMDIADDPFEPGRQIMNGSSVQTDGDWMWRKDLARFVQRRRVGLPPEFLALIRERDYRVPERDEPTLIAYAKQAEELMFGGGR
ncbi:MULTISPECIES: hypothetical protein [Catenuloplanes]|uniref:Uncharacterized protein n=1 Tax=Catenuloplanes niger TaxID=587534 RepID=A0AAE4CUN7_9ACTN|nr:hypothetical protein [Catenuloplanes niger]MDR7324597.1 hypothetical protein [Catenuloplanes niger]